MSEVFSEAWSGTHSRLKDCVQASHASSRRLRWGIAAAHHATTHNSQYGVIYRVVGTFSACHVSMRQMSPHGAGYHSGCTRLSVLEFMLIDSAKGL